MSYEFYAFAGVMSAVLSILAFFPYILDTWRGRTRPERSSWFIWSLLSSLAFVSQMQEGASSSLWFSGSQTATTLLIFVLSIRNGEGGFMQRADRFVLVAAAAGILLWALTDSAVWALVIAITVSFLGGTVTIAKAYRTPSSETLSTWGILVVAAVIGIVSVGGTDPVLLAYPVYLLGLYASIVVAMLLGRRSVVQISAFPGQSTAPDR